MASTQARQQPSLYPPGSGQESSRWGGTGGRDNATNNGSKLSSPTSAKSSSSPSSQDIPRPKRIACVVCRKRKLRCDGTKPSCGTCSRLGHDCSYDEIRRKSGPKRGYVKALEARLAQVETLLKDQNNDTIGTDRIRRITQTSYGSQMADPLFIDGDAMDGIDLGGLPSQGSQPHDSFMDIPDQWSPQGPQTTFPKPKWDVVTAGLEEALPDPKIVDALTKIYFERIHACMPVIHKARYFASMNMAPNLRPPPFLRYAIWTLASSVSDEYASLQTHMYQRARKYLEDTEMRGHGEGIISVSSAQAWLLICTYEFKLMYFPRAWMSCGRAVRLCHMMGLHRLDGSGLEVKQCLPEPKDWIEREERRRTFWSAFCLDRYASIGTGWPLGIEEKDILTNLPSSEEAFEQGRQAKSMSLKDAMTSEGASMVSPFGGVCLMASLFGRNLVHLHRPTDDRDDDLNGEFWKRHRNMDHILLNIQLSLPAHLRLPAGIETPNVVFCNMCVHTSTICLHQAAIFKAEKNRMAPSVSAESKIRCITAAAQIASIMRMVCHLDLSGMNPFMAFCLYVAARVFVQYLKSRPGDEQVRASLQFLLTAMGHMKKANPLTESFLVQLEMDLTGSLEAPGKEEAPPEKSANDIFPTPHPVVELRVEDLAQTINYCPMNQRPSTDDKIPPPPFDRPELTPQPSSNSQSPSTIDHSPSSLDTGDSQNVHTPSSQSNTSGNNAFTPPPEYYSDYAGFPMSVDGIDYGEISKDMMAWDMMNMIGTPGTGTGDMTDLQQKDFLGIISGEY